jgi:hypothetical protein
MANKETILVSKGIPWKNGEKTKYLIKFWKDEKTFIECGNALFNLTYFNGDKTYLIDSWAEINMEKLPLTSTRGAGLYLDEIQLTVDKATMKPILLNQKINNPKLHADVVAKYTDSKVQIDVVSSITGKQNIKLKIPYKTIDTYQALFSFRSLNFDTFKSDNLMVIVAYCGLQLEASLQYQGVETISTLCGTYKCHRLALISSYPKELRQFVFFSIDNPNYLIKYISESHSFELSEIIIP